MWCSGFFILSESQEKSNPERRWKGHRIFFSEGKTGVKNAAAQEKCSVALSTEIASIGLCQPQSNPQPKGVWIYSGNIPEYPVKNEILDWRIKENEQRKIRKERAECPDYCPIE